MGRHRAKKNVHSYDHRPGTGRSGLASGTRNFPATKGRRRPPGGLAEPPNGGPRKPLKLDTHGLSGQGPPLTPQRRRRYGQRWERTPHGGITFSATCRGFGQASQYHTLSSHLGPPTIGKLPSRYGHEQATIHTAEVVRGLVALRKRRPGRHNLLVIDRSAFFAILRRAKLPFHKRIMGPLGPTGSQTAPYLMGPWTSLGSPQGRTLLATAQPSVPGTMEQNGSLPPLRDAENPVKDSIQ